MQGEINMIIKIYLTKEATSALRRTIKENGECIVNVAIKDDCAKITLTYDTKQKCISDFRHISDHGYRLGNPLDDSHIFIPLSSIALMEVVSN